MAIAEAGNRRRKALIAIAGACLLALPFAYSAVVVPLSAWEQAEVSLLMIGLAMLASLSRPLRPLIVFLSGFASLRYFYWRVTSTLNLDGALDGSVSILLLAAEVYGVLVLFLGYFQTIALERRPPAPLKSLPSVDVFIPTYNESVEIVRRTLIGALAIDYPRKQVFLLDDGRREAFEAMARELGCFYLTRPDNAHAKAGNLNRALTRTHGELIAIFDADHVPVRGFLRQTVGFFEDARVALVQAAQHFFNPDPYERNLNLQGRIAPEQTFFYHVIQLGNDFWNSAFFCGSCAVLRRSAIVSIGGFKVQTVTEDAHTALELHARGWHSVYLGVPLAAGLATESFAAHVTQRTRWARGMAQILRLDCPLFKKGLSLPQRLNYSNAMLHFFFGFPCLVMIAAPLLFLLLGIHSFRADVMAVLAYILPHVVLSTVGNSLISERFRHSFWGGVYEVSIAPFTAWVTLLALFNPKLGKFNVTEKGTNIEAARFDFATSRGTLLLVGLSAVALMLAFPLRLAAYDAATTAPAELHAILINALWALANLTTLVAAACVAYEQPQQRNAPRVQRDFPCEMHLPGQTRRVRCLDISESGVRVELETPAALADTCEVRIAGERGAVALRARRVWCEMGGAGRVEAGLAFEAYGADRQRELVELIFSDDRSWLRSTYPRDDPFQSFGYLLTTVWRVTRPRRSLRRRAPRLEGRWPSAVNGRRGSCVSLSSRGGVVELEAPGAHTVATRVEIALSLEAGVPLALRGHVVRSWSTRVALAWEGVDAATLDALETFLASRYAAQGAQRRPFWRRFSPGTGGSVLLLLALLMIWAVGGDGAARLSPPSNDVLRETWAAYVSRFVQPDGRVVDRKAGGITTSEGQAYAMLRAVWMEDRPLFDRTLTWATDHLNRNVRPDHLWAWKWNGRVVDVAFASDADQDVALALLMAARTWGDDSYRQRARAVLADLWDKGTLVAGGRRFLLGGDTLCRRGTCRVNPSYYAPYAYRYFARDDPSHDWRQLVDTSYLVLDRNAALTTTHLPSDWLLLDTATGTLSLGSDRDSQYSYDAFRAHWRVRLDGVLFGEERARAYLASSTAWLAERYRQDGRLRAIILRNGQVGADHEALEMLAGVMSALQETAPEVADAMNARLQGTLSDGLWADRESYYIQNWAWFGTALHRRALAPFERLR